MAGRAVHEIVRSPQNALLLLVNNFDTRGWNLLLQILQQRIYDPKSSFPSGRTDTDSRRTDKPFRFWKCEDQSVAFVIRDPHYLPPMADGVIPSTSWVKLLRRS
jgi:hypothetical protein